MTVAIENLITPEIVKPARYLGNELGSHHKSWQSCQVRWVLTYPEIYELGASNLGHIILYNILNAQPRQLCDRAYLPAPDLGEKLRSTQTPLFALESRHPLIDFDILGFNLSYELGATNILEMLDLAGIPLTWQERDQGKYPLIFAGGQTATSNPEPFADFFDFVALGDGEELLPEIGLVIEEGKANNLNKADLLLDLAQIPGVYVPRFYDVAEDGSVHPNRPDVPKRILRRVATPIPAYSIGLVPYIETIHDRLVLEVRRGCTRGCRFCQPGMLTRPARDVEPEQIINTIEKGIRETGFNEFSLLSLSCSDYLSLPSVGIEIKNRLKNENISLSLPSQRVDRFDENIANIIGGIRQSSLTFAPEAGTQRMRDVINKGLTNEELLRGIQTAVQQGWDRIKLYFMIGLPGETDLDVIGIAETVRWLKRECRPRGKRSLQFTLTISNFTPKPHTPFQWHSVSVGEFIRKQKLLREEFREIRGVKVNYTQVAISAMEDFVGRGDRRLASVVRRAWELGAGMDSWWENADNAYQAWTQAIEEAGLTWKYRQVEDGEWNVFEASDSYDAPLPWDHLDTGIDKEWLKTDLKRALEAATVPDCAFDGCSHCGVCGLDFGHNIVVEPPPIPQFEGHFQPNQHRAQRIRVWFGKIGTMALVSHLDLVRLFDRAVRRGALPISFTGGYHPGPRISLANALSLGITSSGEIVDFELTETMEIEEFRRILTAELPPEIPIYKVEEVDIKSLSATRLLDQAEYLITVQTEEAVSVEQWQSWIEQVKNSSEISYEKTTKSGKKSMVNLRDRLFSLELEMVVDDYLVMLKYIGSCRNDGTMLQPEQVIYMLETVSKTTIELLEVHRQHLILN
ncbi:Radical SAM domain protein [Rippkaea orientalis PCC 8801]|uniref:Radical SAM domain protein n=1 Tax=Rippkaea orientalis (strain PCC 8801 / RF-1) TaxID=41431 RepID=B7JXJ2_RIPO1|nr:TIGR03960 family B12-binding radical SAM protein [Rippkaea orientalis]ACK64749.1 Radical SAM domain protein [Rippkaea orientalis PCC 8801]